MNPPVTPKKKPSESIKLTPDEILEMFLKGFAQRMKEARGMDETLREFKRLVDALPEAARPSIHQLTAILKSNLPRGDVDAAVDAGIASAIEAIAKGRSVPKFDASALA